MVEKTPEQLAQKEVNKRVAKALADIEIERRRLRARVKKLDKKEKKVLDGEIVPEKDGSLLDDDDEDNDSSSSKSTKVIFLLDESGSMQGCLDQTISGFNEYIQTLKKDTKNQYAVTLTKFGGREVNIVYTNKLIKHVPKLSNDNYMPNGLTPLYDAIGKTISKHKINKGNNLFIIITDGQENDSIEYNLDSITKSIKKCESAGWSFVYLGADQDAWASARGLGLARGNVMSFDSRRMGMTMSSLAGSTINFASSKGSTKKFFKKWYYGRYGTMAKKQDKRNKRGFTYSWTNTYSFVWYRDGINEQIWSCPQKSKETRRNRVNSSSWFYA